MSLGVLTAEQQAQLRADLQDRDRGPLEEGAIGKIPSANVSFGVVRLGAELASGAAEERQTRRMDSVCRPSLS